MKSFIDYLLETPTLAAGQIVQIVKRKPNKPGDLEHGRKVGGPNHYAAGATITTGEVVNTPDGQNISGEGDVKKLEKERIIKIPRKHNDLIPDRIKAKKHSLPSE